MKDWNLGSEKEPHQNNTYIYGQVHNTTCSCEEGLQASSKPSPKCEESWHCMMNLGDSLESWTLKVQNFEKANQG